MKKKISALILTATIASSLVVSIAGTASADEKATPVVGAFVFTCTASLPEWPSPSDTGTCGNGPLIPGTAVGGGIHGPNPLIAAAAPFSAVFEYQEPCLAGEPPLVGLANGTATISGSETVQLDFLWARVGVVAVVAGLDPRVGGHSHTGAFAGAATFAPTGTIGTCTDPATPFQAAVAGVAVGGGA